MKKNLITTQSPRVRRHRRVRSRIIGTATRPRLAVYKSNYFISAQIIDDAVGHTIASAHGREFGGTKTEQAISVGKEVAKRAVKEGIKSIVFDRGGYTYAAKIKMLADAARNEGLEF